MTRTRAARSRTAGVTFGVTVAAALSVTAAGSLAAQQAEEVELARWVDDHRPEAVELLEELTNINSYTLNPPGVREVANVLAPHFEALGFDMRWIDGSAFDRAGHLFAERRGSGTRMLVIGHLDTVFPEDDSFDSFTRVDATTVAGPGVGDMKGGLVIILQALQALDAQGLLVDTNITVAMIGDEERAGSPRELARLDLIEAAQWADVALGFEGLETGNSAAIARRGGTGWTLTAKGIRGHSSRIFDDEIGFGAVFEAARILNAFREEFAGEEFLTFSPGLLLGGSEVERDSVTSSGSASGLSNVVAETVVATGDLRTISAAQGQRVIDRMTEIVSENLPGTSATLDFRGVPSGMPPKPGSERLFAIYDETSRDLGFGPIDLISPMRLGGADISTAAPHVDGALAAIGGMGAGWHSSAETADLEKIAIRTKLAAALILRLSRREGTQGR
ncbi:MAG: M20/M25/M40 family metallo-hydrolase [Longimicrobiales bacterium]|nr:M20/M25/M40 family metallo-hydrolase [Longimicrobiales bacterium]